MSGMVVLAFFPLVCWIVGLVWVATDATVNSTQSAFFWGLVEFFGGVLGVVLYLLRGGPIRGRAPIHES